MKTNWKLLSIVAAAVIIIVVVGVLQPIRPTIIISNSMEPLLLTDSVVLVDTSSDFDDMGKGDIIRYTHSTHGPVMHRIQQVITLESGEKVFMTKGDHNAFIDDWQVTEEMYTGEVVGGWNWTQPLLWSVFGDFSELSQVQIAVRGILLGMSIIIALLLVIWVFIKGSSMIKKQIRKTKIKGV